MSDITDFDNFEDVLRMNLTPYSPVDLGNLKPVNNIKTSRELEKESKNISDILSDKSK